MVVGWGCAGAGRVGVVVGRGGGGRVGVGEVGRSVGGGGVGWGGWGWWGGWWWRGGGWCDEIIFLMKFKFSKMVCVWGW